MVEATEEKIAVIGLKGFPSDFIGTSGIESYIENIIGQKSFRNKEYVCYVRNWAKPHSSIKKYPNVELVVIPTIKQKILDPLIYSFLASVYVCFSDQKIVWYQAIGTSLFCFLPKIFGKKIIITIHGLDWQRTKWSFYEGLFIYAIFLFILHICDELVVVSEQLRTYIKKRWKKDSFVVTPIITALNYTKSSYEQVLKKYPSIRKRKYILFLGRLVPEKRVEWLIRAFSEIHPQNYQLVIAGDESNTHKYKEQLLKLTQNFSNVIFTGYVFGGIKWALIQNCSLFVLPSQTEGNSISLLEAISLNKSCLVAKNFIPNSQLKNKRISGFKKNSYSDFKQSLANFF